MYEQRDVKDRLVPRKRGLRETVLLLTAHPAPGSLCGIPESVPACSRRDKTIVCRSAVGIFRRDQASCCVVRGIIRLPSGSCDPERETCPGDHAGTIPGADAGAGDRIQTSDPGSASR